MRIPADFAHGGNFIVKSRPILCQHMLARNHDVDFICALFDGIGDFNKAERQRRRPVRRESLSPPGNRNAGTLKRLHGMGHHGGINTEPRRW